MKILDLLFHPFLFSLSLSQWEENGVPVLGADPWLIKNLQFISMGFEQIFLHSFINSATSD